MKFYTNPPEIGEKIENMLKQKKWEEERLYKFLYNYENRHRVLFLNKNIRKAVNEIKKMKIPFRKKIEKLHVIADTILLKEYIKNYAKKSKITVSNTNINFMVNKIKNIPETLRGKKKSLKHLMNNMTFPPILSENVKKRTNKNRKITRKKGNTTKSRLSK
jgi:hypothetical protein